MKLKVRPSDFKVTERLKEGIITPGGGHRVYRVIKEKLTSMEAATELAAHTGVSTGDIGMAGLKDRQGVTTQFMSVARGPSVSVSAGAQSQSLGIQSIGFCEEAITAEASDGNDFQIVIRDLRDGEVDHLRTALEPVRASGLPNYFDSQRFGNLRHGQGWIVLDLLQGDVSGALKRLVASTSSFEPPARRRLKEALGRSWGDWSACRSIAGKLGRHHSVFEHLKRDPDDFEGAFDRVGTRERLIHLYAFQSHLWNRALALWVQDHFEERISLRGIEGMLRFPVGEFQLPPEWGGQFMLAGSQLDGVTDPLQRELYERTLERLGLTVQALDMPNLAGFQLKPEPRPAIVHPLKLRVRPAEEDNLHRGARMVKVEFGLPRGAYATMVIQRLVGQSTGGVDERPPAAFQPSREERGERGGGHDFGGDRSDAYGDPRGNDRGDSYGGEYGGDRRGGARRGGVRGGGARRGGSRRGAPRSGGGGYRGGGFGPTEDRNFERPDRGPRPDGGEQDFGGDFRPRGGARRSRGGSSRRGGGGPRGGPRGASSRGGSSRGGGSRGGGPRGAGPRGGGARRRGGSRRR
ncbi:tRNA pseudouridine synthase D [Planctomycetes bacterium Poly30]|uniref:tRNA pseudouridine synthase D n=1 Tax=Saltatorellus ferox TaxID=2528018 RepID=A0A518EQ98_9BACT|nr:tRNA pseudouridine synthase D [Planctomycetes bacterium Poly30]